VDVRHYNELLGFFVRSVRDVHEAQDLVQQTFERMLSREHAGRRAEHPRALMYEIARNLLVDRHRHLSVRLHDSDDTLRDYPAQPGCEPELVYAGMQRVRLLIATIEALPPRCREAFVRHRIDGLSHADVASEMGISLNMVERHIMLAVATCRKALGDGLPSRRAAPQPSLA
jgi:RNA polymerase sigma-70 factor (ECF subfamily)